jgi:Spy/CpxP family protein refolding chaperone
MTIPLLVLSLVMFQSAGKPKVQPGAEGPPIAAAHEPTPFERFAEKLTLDEAKQMPEAGRILSGAAAQGSAIGRDMIAARLRLVEVDGKPEAAPVMDALNAGAAKMAALDAKTFQQVYALLDKGQQKSAPEAFVLEAGMLDMSTPRAGGARGRSIADIRPGRLELLTTLFTLTGDQKKQVKTIMDADYKASSAARDQWTASRTAIGKAIQSGAQADIDAAVTKHAADAAQMAAAEARALAKIFAVLTPEQKANTTAIQMAVFHMRLAFAGKKWDVSPE